MQVPQATAEREDAFAGMEGYHLVDAGVVSHEVSEPSFHREKDAAGGPRFVKRLDRRSREDNVAYRAETKDQDAFRWLDHLSRVRGSLARAINGNPSSRRIGGSG